MRVVSIGDLVLDYYYKNGKLLGVNGGMTSHNIIANLAKMGLNTSVYGSCGNDIQGEMTIKSLKKINVDVSNIKKLEGERTRAFHVSYFENDDKLTFISKKRCPFCNNKSWYNDSLIDVNSIIEDIKNDDILVFDNLNDKNQIIIDDINNKKIIDLGQYFEFENLEEKEIINKIRNKFEIINFNERVSKYLINKLNLKNDLELFKLLSPKFMTITKGDAGASFIYKNNIYNFSLINKGNVADSTGAGDAFISSIIRDVIKNNFEYDPNLFKKWYENSNKLTSKVVSKMGARGHINSLFKIKNDDNKCTCDSFIYNERKQIKRCNLNINNLETRITNAVNSGVCNKVNNIDFNENNQYIVDKIIFNCIESEFKFIDDSTKEYIVRRTVDALLTTGIGFTVDAMKALKLKEITTEQVEIMDPREIHMLFNAFAGDFFIKLYLYGSMGAVFGLNMYLSIVLWIADWFYSKKVDEFEINTDNIFKE